MIEFDFFVTIFLLLMTVLVHGYKIRALRKKPAWGDSYTYLRIAMEIRQKKRVPKYLNFYYQGNEEKEKFTLPPLLMLILAPFVQLPYRKVILFPSFLDILVAFIVLLVTRLQFDCTWLQAFSGACIYLLSPLNTETSRTVTPRPLGLIFFLLFLIFATLYWTEQGAAYFFLSCLSMALAFLSQRMVSQIIYLLSPFVVLFGYAFWGEEWLFLLGLLFLAFFSAMVLTKLRYLEIFNDHFQRVRLHAIHGDQRTFQKKLGNPVTLIKSNPWLLFLPIFLLPDISLVPAMHIMSLYLNGCIFLGIFWIFGNGVNHIYFASPLVAILVAPHLFANNSILAATLLIAICCAFLIIRSISSFNTKYLSEDWNHCLDWIKKNKFGGSVIVVPQITCPPLIFFTNLHIVSASHGSKAVSFNRLFLKRLLNDTVEFLRFIHENFIDFVLVDKKSLSAESNTGDTYKTISKMKKLYENETLLLLSSQPARGD